MKSNTDSRAANRILLVLFVGVLMGALDIAIAGPALPAIQASYHVDDRAIAWVFTIYVLFNLIGTPLMARLSDVLGRRSIYMLDVTLFGLGSLVVALSPSFEVLLLGRAVQGLGAGGIFPIASAVIGDTFPPERRGRALGLIGAVFGLAFIIGPILGGILLTFSWHWLFLVNLPIAAGLLVVSGRLLPATRPAQRRPFDWPGMTLLAVLLSAMTYGLNQIDSARFVQSLTSPGVWPFLLLAVILLPVFWFVERRMSSPVLPVSLFVSRQVALVAAFALASGLGEASVVFGPKILKSAFGVSESTASFMLVPLVLTMAIGSPLAGRLLDRLGSRVIVLAGSGLLAAGMITLGLWAHELVLFYVGAGLVGFALGILLGAPLRYIILAEAPATQRAAAQGALALFTSTGQLVGGAVVGAIAASRGGGVAGYENAYLLVGGLVLLLTTLGFGLKSRAEEAATMHHNVAPPLGEPQQGRA
jgi:EmrB/QacA subfamily drug resistance transporter